MFCQGAAGFDLIFAAPKSVSVVHGLAGAELEASVRAAHDRAVGDAVGYLERQACVIRRSGLGQAGQGYVAASFRHRTSRSNDPHLHTHVLIANLSPGLDNRWTALHTPRLFQHLQTADALYLAVLRNGITRGTGLTWTTTPAPELRGVPRMVIDAFSHRRAQILAGRQPWDRPPRHGLVDMTALAPQWQARAQQLGFEVPSPTLAVGCHVEVERGIGVARILPALSRDGQGFTRDDAVRAWCRALPQGGRADAIEALADQTLTCPSVRKVGRHHHVEPLERERKLSRTLVLE